MSNRGRTEFLERGSYRQRRFRDAARMVPLFAAVMMLLPLMWPRAQTDQSLTSSGIYYLFGLWVVLVVIAFALSRVLQFETPDDSAEGAGKKGGDE
ncbi:hypothetical protein L0664_04375 [Octadecabacter sp. G9-8]|uniref:DUF3311 domain-containing protein n=1 Tax=Octadecabacter dasysiphoniae TaxID=2909341 RepID=A0ABS9CSU8_9RHOB|nr:hypothetical protein [Octadecabacter dasysiphoniae]MCF2870295.1 hypothetical protein [Octadecabacter dasysiphoniae]